MEQREGRIHRYKNHAVRKNVAATQRAIGLAAASDPWSAMFDAATEQRAPHANDLVPSWIYTNGDARIERYVPDCRLAANPRGSTRCVGCSRHTASCLASPAKRAIPRVSSRGRIGRATCGLAAPSDSASATRLHGALDCPGRKRRRLSTRAQRESPVPAPPSHNREHSVAAAPTRARPTYQHLPHWAVYGHTMKALASLGGSATAAMRPRSSRNSRRHTAGATTRSPVLAASGGSPPRRPPCSGRSRCTGMESATTRPRAFGTLQEPRDFEEAPPRRSVTQAWRRSIRGGQWIPRASDHFSAFAGRRVCSGSGWESGASPQEVVRSGTCLADSIRVASQGLMIRQGFRHVTGRLPDLESALLERIACVRSADPFSPIESSSAASFSARICSA